MRIPLEALAQLFTGRNAPESRRAEPISPSHDLGDAPQYSLQQWAPPEEQAQPAQFAAAQEAPARNRRSSDTHPFEERRTSPDRRQHSIPVLLDTRLTPCRRKTDRAPGISLKA